MCGAGLTETERCPSCAEHVPLPFEFQPMPEQPKWTLASASFAAIFVVGTLIAGGAALIDMFRFVWTWAIRK